VAWGVGGGGGKGSRGSQYKNGTDILMGFSYFCQKKIIVNVLGNFDYNLANPPSDPCESTLISVSSAV